MRVPDLERGEKKFRFLDHVLDHLQTATKCATFKFHPRVETKYSSTYTELKQSTRLRITVRRTDIFREFRLES
jgi:hypothetical protein